MKILAFAEHRNGELRKNAFEAVTAARNLSAASGGSFAALIVGAGVSQLAAQLGEYGASDVIVVDDQRLQQYAPAAVATAIASVVRAEGADVVLLSATSHGRDLAASVAAKLGAGLAADIVTLEYRDGNVVAGRPVYAGKARTEVVVQTPVKVFSLRPNVFTPTKAPVQASARTAGIELGDGDLAAKVVETKVNTGRKDVAEADIVVAGGRGLKAAENFKLVEDLAEVLGAAVGASRAVVDAGWRPHAEQVGQTGKTVSPVLYVACGVSGAVQHLAGMSSSKYIVAINKDKDAPIFSVADYGIVGDAFEILPLMTQEIRALHSR